MGLNLTQPGEDVLKFEFAMSARSFRAKPPAPRLLGTIYSIGTRIVNEINHCDEDSIQPHAKYKQN